MDSEQTAVLQIEMTTSENPDILCDAATTNMVTDFKTCIEKVLEEFKDCFEVELPPHPPCEEVSEAGSGIVRMRK